MRTMVRALAAALLVVLPALATATKAAPPAGACADPRYHEFDFWIGDWEVVDAVAPGKPVAAVRVTAVLEGCALKEEYRDSKGLRGLSLSSFVAARGVWQQTWLTNRGELLVLEGGVRGAALVLEGNDVTPDGKPRRTRGTWQPVAEGVRETAVRSTDGGVTWQPWFDLLFRAAGPATRRGASAVR